MTRQKAADGKRVLMAAKVSEPVAAAVDAARGTRYADAVSVDSGRHSREARRGSDSGRLGARATGLGALRVPAPQGAGH
jgi:hypothetical protein